MHFCTGIANMDREETCRGNTGPLVEVEFRPAADYVPKI